jgi:hypothetical protein
MQYSHYNPLRLVVWSTDADVIGAIRWMPYGRYNASVPVAHGVSDELLSLCRTCKRCEAPRGSDWHHGKLMNVNTGTCLGLDAKTNGSKLIDCDKAVRLKLS